MVKRLAHKKVVEKKLKLSSAWQSREERLAEHENRAAEKETAQRRPNASVKSFQSYGYSSEEAKSLVHDRNLIPSSTLGRKFCQQRLAEVSYYVKELGLTWEEAIERAEILSAELSAAPFVVSPTGAFSDILKWHSKFTSKRIVWEGNESVQDAVARFRGGYTVKYLNEADAY